MAARDKYHHVIVEALEKDNWIVTDDPLSIRVKGSRVQVDLGAERLIGARKGKEKIAVEVKTFGRKSMLPAFYEASGQYMTYRAGLQEMPEHQNRILFLAISEEIYGKMQAMPFLLDCAKKFSMKIIIINLEKSEITQWINWTTTEKS